jgi:hypothetical protein
MKYLCIVHLDESRIAAEDKEVWTKVGKASHDYDEALKRSGHFLAAEALQAPETAAIVRPKGSEFSVTDGPFVEVKEHVGGFILIEARDLNEAISIAAKIPVAQYGAVEVRPVMEF